MANDAGKVKVAALVLAGVIFASGAHAQETSRSAARTPAADAPYPSKPIRFVLGFPPGGASDTMARLLGTRMAESLGQPVVIDNRPGAGGNIAAEIVARSVPDGHTLLLGNNGILAINASLYPKIGFDPLKDFAPVVLVASQPNILVVHPSVAANSVKELIALAKAKPGQLSYASPGAGTTGHLAAELFKRMAGVDYVIISYKGGGPAMLANVAGECQLSFATALSVAGYLKGGRLKALAVTTAKRSPNFPELPTVAEAGVPGFDAITWHGIVVPARTPQPAIARLNGEINKLLQTADMRQRLAALGSDPIGGAPKELTDYMRVEIPRWAKVIKESGAKAE
jgi:tripartite-type tricarboxylate transporter receptor subunit TctC